jgi:catechol 2,3-dioxygenase-like lactoylglutathione lyase family enzyme
MIIRTPQINLYALDILKSVAFYSALGFVETFRTPQEGHPDHVELILDGFTIGIASAAAAATDHGLQPQLNGRAIEIVLWTDDTDGAFAQLTATGSRALSAPHDWLDDLRIAWVTDPDDNPIQLVQRRT